MASLMRILHLVGMICTLLFGASETFADDGFSCGGADVRFSFVERTELDYVEAILTIRRDGRETILRYDGNIDFIGGVCITGKRNQPKVVFQAYCGGSGCFDLDNWGIIDPKDLLVELVPNDWNRKDAQRILGRPLPEIEPMFHVRREGEKLGVKR